MKMWTVQTASLIFMGRLEALALSLLMQSQKQRSCLSQMVDSVVVCLIKYSAGMLPSSYFILLFNVCVERKCLFVACCLLAIYVMDKP